MTFKRLLSDAEPHTAARAALIMAAALAGDETASDADRGRAEQLLAIGAADLTDQIRSIRQPSSAHALTEGEER